MIEFIYTVLLGVILLIQTVSKHLTMHSHVSTHTAKSSRSAVFANWLQSAPQHSLIHYHKLIRVLVPEQTMFLYYRIKHIKAVKQPCDDPSRFEHSARCCSPTSSSTAAASRIDFTDRGMLRGPVYHIFLKKLGMSNLHSYP